MRQPPAPSLLYIVGFELHPASIGKAMISPWEMHPTFGRPFFAALLLLSTSSSFAELVRWYSHEQVQRGQQIYERKCAKCHGEDAAGEPDWRKIDEDGEYPPPPLNGDAYAWHYSLDQLRRQIQLGSDENDGDMPAFKGKLSVAEIDAVIAFFQSTWSDITYVVWQSKQFPSAGESATGGDESSQQLDTHWLRRHLSAARITPGEPMKTPVKGIREVRVRDEYVYLTEDGRYAFTGQMIDLRDGSNLTKLNEAMETRRLLQAFPAADMLIYPATAQERSQLTIFTDSSCGYCRKMHEQVPLLQSQGVTVRFIPYPRRGQDGNGYAALKAIWCADDPRAALSSMMEQRVLPDSPSDCERAGAVDAGYRLGNRIGISGTPLLVLENGEKIKGYKPASEVLSRMNITAEP